MTFLSTLTGENHTKILMNEEDLIDYFQQNAKSAQTMKIGLEAEFFGVDKRTGQAIPYFGTGGIQEVLDTLSKKFEYQSIYEGDNIIALKPEETFIALEPGAQIELSAQPVWNVFEIEGQLQEFFAELHAIADQFPNIAWLAVGIHPFSALSEIPWVPKKRYEIMAEHFRLRGSLSHHMMKRTAATQVNFDYLTEEHAMESVRVALAITSIVTAMFAHSSFSDGKPNGYLCKRLDIWNHTDPDRSGLPVEFIKEGKTFENYLDYVLDIPMIFVFRDGHWIPARNQTFRDFLRNGFEGMRPTLGDFELHLSTVFPEVRIKKYIEIRGADCQRPDLIPAVAAFWKGILYDDWTRKEVWKLVSDASERDRLKLHQEVPHQGLDSRLGSKPILPIARELVELACDSLRKQKKGRDSDECCFLARIREQITGPGKSPAEILVSMWYEQFVGDPARLIDYLRIK
ncbi:MAG: glutamate-cysteine ligase family protein [Candidatus Omnitrophica bacterium]|nr:glutamate-cysteine ligase family protein [Candidatus Omnitrophota bacterium]